MAGRYQKDGVLTTGAVGKYSSYNVDFLLEKRIKGAGAFAIEAAWYNYDTDDIIKAEQGKAYSAGASYIFEQKAGWGKFQPFVRWQKFAADPEQPGQHPRKTSQYQIEQNPPPG